MKKSLLVIVVLGMVLSGCACKKEIELPVLTPKATVMPTEVPTDMPATPTDSATEPTSAPDETTTIVPTKEPTVAPTATPAPTVAPAVTLIPTAEPKVTPVTVATATPIATIAPTPMETYNPTAIPKPTDAPTATLAPTATPVMIIVPTDTIVPTVAPTKEPTKAPTAAPTATPTPTIEVTIVPTLIPEPTKVPEYTVNVTVNYYDMNDFSGSKSESFTYEEGESFTIGNDFIKKYEKYNNKTYTAKDVTFVEHSYISKEGVVVNGLAYGDVNIYYTFQYLPSDSDTSHKTVDKVTNPKVHDLIYMGKFEQDDKTSNGPENIEWIVLDVDKTNHKMLLMSTKILKCITWGYAPNYNGCTWNNSYAREWLNNDFYMMAFTPQEREKIVMTYLEDPNYDSVANFTFPGSQDTEDRIFLLTLDEVIHKYDFHNDSYFKKNGIFQTPYCIRDEFDTNYADMGLGFNTEIDAPWVLARNNGFNGVDYCASFHILDIEGKNSLSWDNGGSPIYDLRGVAPVMWVSY